MTNQTFQIGDRVRVLDVGDDTYDDFDLDRPFALFGPEVGDEALVIEADDHPVYGPMLTVEFEDGLTQFVRANQIELAETGDTAVAPTTESAVIAESFEEWEKELLGIGTDKRPDLNVGDIVRITGFTPEFAQNEGIPTLAKFVGLEAEVLDPAEPLFGVPWVRPLSERPDGFGLDEFGTLGFTVELVTPAAETKEAEPVSRLSAVTDFKVGDRVNVDNYDDETGTINGFGTVSGHGVTGTYVEVDLDNGHYALLFPSEMSLVRGDQGTPEVETFDLTGSFVLDFDAADALPQGTIIVPEGSGATATKQGDRFVRVNPISGHVYDMREISDPSIEPWRVVFDPSTV